MERIGVVSFKSIIFILPGTSILACDGSRISNISLKQILHLMDIFKSPWKTTNIVDPIMSLSNSQRGDRKNPLADRYCFESLSKNLFHVDKQQKPDPNAAGGKNCTSEQKDRNYRCLLVKTCSSESEKKTKANMSIIGYSSKVKRQGYLLDHESLPDESPASRPRNIPKQPYRILNAPRLKDDFYTSLLDWSPEDIVSVVLDNAVYIWSSKESDTEKLVEGFISSVKWGKGLVIGEETGKIRVIDAEKKRQVTKNRNHNGRIGTLDCSSNLVTSGSKDCNVAIWDVRAKEVVHKWEAHRQEVCGVKFSSDGNMVASGGNDNVVSIWDIRASKNIHKFNEHTAAVKALAWSPHQTNILATGGGSTDKSIRVWGLNEGRCIKKIDTGSQVCNMMYSRNSNQLVSTHGFSMNAINVWDGKNMEKISTLRGHSYRVLYLAHSPDGESIVTGSGDQTLRFWKVFPSNTGIYSRASILEPKNIFLR